MSKAKVPLWQRPQNFAVVDTEATKGATVGVNLYWPGGAVVTEADLAQAAAAPASPVSRTLWSLVLRIPANVQAVAGLASAGFVRRDGVGAWTASPIVNADLSGADTDGLTEGTNLYFTDGRAQAAVVAAAITPGDTTHAPSGDAVNTALAGKYDKSGGTISGQVDIINGVQSLTLGADGALPVRTDATNKLGRIGFCHYLNAEENVTVLSGFMDATRNILQWGGSTSLQNAATEHRFYTAANSTTLVGTHRWTINSSGHLHPAQDNVYQVGIAGNRVKEIYCGNNVINTSDAREKTPLRPLDDVELAIARDLAGIVGIYQWLAAIAEKGEDGARLHCGAIAQQVIAAFEAHGRDAFRYGIACYDEWPESREPATDDSPEVIHPAGNRYSLRYGELSMFLIAGQEARLRALEAKA